MLLIVHPLVFMSFLVGSDFINVYKTALAFIFSDISVFIYSVIWSALWNWYTFLLGFFGMWGLRLTSNIIARWSDIPGTACMFSMRFWDVRRRSRILFEVGLMACEISCERELFKRKSRSTSSWLLLVQPVCHVSQSIPGRLKSHPIIILGDDLLWRVISLL